jgi:predicted peroxiredoxin
VATILYISTWGSDDPTRATIPFHLANGALEAGHTPMIALAAEASYVMKDGIADLVHGVGIPPLKELMAKLSAAGVEIFI